MANLDFMEGKDLYLNQAAVKKLIELIMNEVRTSIPGIINAIPGTEDEVNKDDVKGKLPTVLAVFNALKTVDHIKFRVIKGNEGQTFEDAMTGKVPEEVALYFYRTTDAKNFDLYIYDSTKGEYFPVGKDTISAEDLGLDQYWSKSELDINAYWSKSELNIEDFVTQQQIEDLVAGSVDLTGYVKKEDLGTLTAEQVEAIWNQVKSGTGSTSSTPAIDTAGGQAGGWEE